MDTSRRQALKLLGATSVVAFVHEAMGSIGAMGRSAGSIGSGVVASGFLPSGHYLARIQPLVLAYPRPDSETSANARHHWAFYQSGSPPMLFDIPINVIGGSYPHIPVLQSGPPGMTIVLPNYSAGPPYPSPRLQWTPTASWSGTVSIRWYSQEYQTDSTQYIDQSFTLATTGDIANGGKFIFHNADTGVNTNSGGYASPLSANLSDSFGSTWNTVPKVGTIATAGMIAVLMNATAEYVIPLYTDGNITSTGQFEINTSTKPMSLIRWPGATAKFSVASGHLSCAESSTSADWFIQGMNPDGYVSTAANALWFFIAGNAGGAYRITFDQCSWTNSGYGATGNSNATGIWSSDTGGPLRQYVFINEGSESNRTSGSPGNNYAGFSLYTCQYALAQGFNFDQPTFTGDCACYFKSDCTNSEIRGCYVNVSSVGHAFSMGQVPHNESNYFDSTYNLGVNINGIWLPQTGNNGYIFGLLRGGRNSVIGTHGLVCSERMPFSITTQPAGTLTNGTYNGVSLTNDSSSGSGVTANITVSGGAVTIINYSSVGTGYKIGDTLFIPSASIPGATANGVVTIENVGPFVFDSNALQTTFAVPPTGPTCQDDGLNISAASGLLDTSTGLLTGAYANPPSTGGKLGIAGAQISGTL